jgi:catechol 2,3-dioxygenase-like lactoylglutathione lyase family enzyme
MGAAIDHVGIPSTDPESAGRFLAEILGEGRVEPDGPDESTGDMYSLHLNGWSLSFVRTDRPDPIHLAIRSTPEIFWEAISRLKREGIPFGNDPEDPANGQTEDPLGGVARAYFRVPDGHLYELVVPEG